MQYVPRKPWKVFAKHLPAEIRSMSSRQAGLVEAAKRPHELTRIELASLLRRKMEKPIVTHCDIGNTAGLFKNMQVRAKSKFH